MSKFKYEWQVGDKFKQVDRGIKGRVIKVTDGILRFTHLESPVTRGDRGMWQPLVGRRDSYGSAFDTLQLKPLGKKTKARYQAAKLAWEAEQFDEAITAEPMAERIPAEFWDLPIGSWVEFKRDEDFFNLKAGDKVQTTSALKMDGMINFQHPDQDRGFCSIRTKFLRVCDAPRSELPVGSYAVMTENACFRDGGVKIAKGAKVKILRGHPSRKPDEYRVQDLSDGKYMDGIWHTEGSKMKPLKTVWDLQKGDECYRLTAAGAIHRFKFDAIETLCRDRGNLFLTREEAEAADAERVAAVKASR